MRRRILALAVVGVLALAGGGWWWVGRNTDAHGPSQTHTDEQRAGAEKGAVAGKMQEGERAAAGKEQVQEGESAAVAAGSMQGGERVAGGGAKVQEGERAATEDWNTFHGDSALRGVAETVLPDPLEVLWRWKTGAPVSQTPVVCEGRVYAVTDRGDVLAADLDGKPLWSRELLTGEMKDGAPIRHRVDAPIAAFDGLVLAGTEEGILYALDAATGQDKWRADMKGVIRGSANYRPPANAAEPGRVYSIEQPTGMLVCFDAATGKELWRAEGEERSDGHPSVSDKTVVFGSCASAMHVFDVVTGQRLRDIPLGKDAQVAGGMAQDGGQAISGSRGGNVFAVRLDTGEVLWKNPTDEAEVFSTPAVSKERVVVCDSGGLVFCIDRATGKTLWQYDSGGSPESPVLAGDKIILSVDGELVLLNLADGQERWSLKLGDMITAPAMIHGMVLVGCEDGTVVALGAAKESTPQ